MPKRAYQSDETRPGYGKLVFDGDDESLASFITECWRELKQCRIKLERCWAERILAQCGKSAVVFDPETASFRPMEDKNTYILRANRYRQLITSRISNLMAGQPEWRVPAATQGDDDMLGSELGELALRHYYDACDMPERLIDAAMWAINCSVGWFHPCWDATKPYRRSPRATFQTTATTYDQALPETNGFHAPQEVDLSSLLSEETEEPIGDIKIDVFSPFDLVAPTLKCRIDQVPWVITGRLESLDDLEDEFPDADLSELTARCDDPDGTLLFWREVVRVYTNNYDEDSIDRYDNAAMVLRFWLKPSGRFPNGRRVVVCQGKVIHSDDFPYDHGKLPFLPLYETREPWALLGGTNAGDVLEMNVVENWTRGRLAMLADKHAKYKYLVYDEGGTELFDLDNSDAAIPTVRGQEPSPLIPPPFPQVLTEFMAQTRRDYEDIAAQHKVSQGRETANARSGVAIEALKEADLSAQGLTLQSLANCLRLVGQQVLGLLQQYARDERMLQVSGEDGEDLWATFSGAMLRGDPHVGWRDFDVRVRVSPARSPALTVQIVQVLAQMQFLRPGEHDAEVFRMLGEFFPSNNFDPQRRERRIAVAENYRMLMGEQVKVMARQNHVVHIEQCRRIMDTARYRKAAPEIQKIVEGHCVEHERQLFREPLRLEFMALQERSNYLTLVQTMAQSGAINPIALGGGEQGGTPGGQNGEPPPEQSATEPKAKQGAAV